MAHGEQDAGAVLVDSHGRQGCERENRGYGYQLLDRHHDKIYVIATKTCVFRHSDLGWVSRSREIPTWVDREWCLTSSLPQRF